jgi:predicted DNA-binding transcriptional regulator AlpA
MEKVVLLTESEIFDLVRQAALAAAAELRDNLRPAPPEHMTKVQVAEYFGRSPATIDRWMAEKGLPFKKVDEASRPIFIKKDVDDWLRTRN